MVDYFFPISSAAASCSTDLLFGCLVMQWSLIEVGLGANAAGLPFVLTTTAAPSEISGAPSEISFPCRKTTRVSSYHVLNVRK